MAARAQDVHFVAGDLYRVALDRAFVRPVDRGVLRGAERAEPRLAEAQVGAAASRRQSARSRFRAFMDMDKLSAVWFSGNRLMLSR